MKFVSIKLHSMKKLVFVLLFSCCRPMHTSAQVTYLVRNFSHTAYISDYTWLTAGQPIGFRTATISLNFDEEIKSCRFIGISNDTLIVERILALKDTIITRRKKDHSFAYTCDGAWKFGRTIARRKQLITECYQMIVTSDILFVPLAEISHIRTYRRSVQRLKDSGMEFAALLPPMFAYLMYINAHPARNYAMRHWRFVKHMPFEES